MTNDLALHLNQKKVKSLILSNNTTVIGQETERCSEYIEYKALFSLEPILVQGVVKRVLTPTVPSCFDTTSRIFRNHIVIESETSIELKKMYFDILLERAIANVDVSNKTKDRWTT